MQLEYAFAIPSLTRKPLDEVSSGWSGSCRTHIQQLRLRGELLPSHTGLQQKDIWPAEKTVRLCDEFRDHVLLIVKHGQLLRIYPAVRRPLKRCMKNNRDRGFSVLGFPSNDFLQEPRGEEKVQEFCRLTYNVQIPDVREKSRCKKTRRAFVSGPR